MDPNSTVWMILLLPLCAAAIIVLGLKRSPGISALVSTGSAVITLLLSLQMLSVPEGTKIDPFTWLNLGEHFTATIGFTIDPLSQGMMIVVTGVGALVHIFSLAYMKDDAGKARYFAGLSLFMFSMTGIVLADNFVMMFIFWELVGVSSYILIGHWFEKDAPADASKKAFLVNRIGDFGMMIGVLLVWVLTGSIYFADFTPELVGGIDNVGLLNVAVLLVFCGAVGKSAQVPLHVWLPDAMEGPTPVSALIHAATMVAAGVYMLARVTVLVGAAESAANVIMLIGAFTALLAALMATQQNDIKRILAYSTLSQLGYMVMAQGIAGGSDAGMFHLFTHAWFKALLFLGAGAVIFACHHEQDIWKMGGLRKKMPITFWAVAAGTAALIAVPFTSGFWSKEAILEAALHEEHLLVYAVGITVAFLTPFYMTRLFIVAFLGKARTDDASHAREVPPIMWVPLAILGVLSIFSVYGFISEPLKASGHADFGHFFGHIGATAILSLIGLVVGVLGAWKLYGGRDSDPVRIPLFANKFYFDEIYQSIVAVCQDFVAMLLDSFDKYVIEPLTVRLPAIVATGSGYVLRLIQVGNLQGYAFLFAAGVVAVIWFLVF